MDISAIQGTANSSPELTASINMNSEDFLKLVVAQFENQDPTNPVSNEDFVLQLSQLTTLEQMQDLTATVSATSPILQLSSSASMMGKLVQFTNPDIGGNETGVVDKVVMKNGKILMEINGLQVPFTNLTQVLNSSNSSNPTI